MTAPLSSDDPDRPAESDAAQPAAAAPAPGSSAGSSAGARWLRAESLSRRLLIGALVYVACTCVYASFAGRDRLVQHTAFNHYALLADAWLHGRQDLGGPPPFYTQNNDFAEYHGKTYISFPPLPAMLMLPFVKLAGTPENFRDGQFVVWLAGLAPAVLFLVLEKLRRTGRSPRSERENLALAMLYAFGTVYFFTAVEGTVWFAALVVASAAIAFYALFALDAERPALAGAMMACVYLSRPTAIWMSLLFAVEALRVSLRAGPHGEGPWGARLRAAASCLDVRGLARRYTLFSVPILGALALITWMNWSRYGRATPIYFDHEFLAVAWRGRMLKWGLIGYHYLAKNLGVALTSLPWLPAAGESRTFGAPFKVNEHGLALWVTTPLYLWLLWPKRLGDDPARRNLYVVCALSAAVPALMDLLYQNSGWRQFGYRFSNDYSILLFVLLAIGARPMGKLFFGAAAWSVACNAFGAATFDRAQFDRFYYRDGSQTVVYQPD